jgi:AraC-like DNA-binding protein
MPVRSAPPQPLPLPGVRSFIFISNRDKFTHEAETSQSWTLLGSQAGKFRYSVGDLKTGVCLPGEFVLCPPRTPLRRKILEKMNFYVAFFSWRPPGPRAWAGKYNPRDTARLDSTLARLHLLQTGTGGEGIANWRNHLVSDLLNLCAYESSNPAAAELKPEDRLILKILEYLQKNLVTNRSLGEIARESGISPFQLSRRFQSTFGVSPAIYRTRLRMKHARHLLLETSWTTERIAAECGFDNAFYFSRVFSRENGQPPTVFRRNTRF